MYAPSDCSPAKNKVKGRNPLTCEFQEMDVHFLDTAKKIRHIYLLDNDSEYGKVYNAFVAEQLRL
jgi:hypothetical protein